MTDIVEKARALLAKPTTPITDLRNGIRDLADECERLSAALDAMTNQAVMASGRRATIVTEDGELERLRAENARLREAMPSDDVRDEINDASVMLHEDGGMPATLAWLARLDAAKEGR